MKSNDVRSSFLDFFARRGHKVVPSSSLIPYDDPTLLFTNAGMNQFKNVFLGLEKRDYKTATSSQKCLRAGGKHNDLENVGFTARHHTFFEMLGNFSFGDYFKEEAIKYAWDYVVKTLGLDPKRLYTTVFTEDDDAERLWKKIAPELGERVLRFGEHDNFWSMGETGPCGPCSEIHYDRGPKYPGELNGDGDRYMEIWNLVFMQYNRDEQRALTPLPKPSVDTGAGLERFCMILQNAESNYDTDLFAGMIKKVSELSGKEYSDTLSGVSHRVISDHVRALTFAIADGGIISNEGRGYVLRRILRRAARHGRLLGLHEPFLHKIVKPLVDTMGGHYAEIKAKQSHVELVIRSEEEQFSRTLDTGLEIFEDIAKKVESSGAKLIPGSEVFRLYDTYGFPVDLTEVMARERGLHVDLEGFEKELERQQERSRISSKFALSFEETGFLNLEANEKTEFVGYDRTSVETVLLRGTKTAAIIGTTPFYAESGGQVGDKGVIESGNYRFVVEDTQKMRDAIVHMGHLEKSPSLHADRELIRNVKVRASIDESRRADIKRNHTATHLLHKALRMVLGEHVHQAGSLVAPDRLRFDFTHFKAMTPEEIDRVEQIVIEKIKEDLKVNPIPDVPLDEAKKMGAMALFGEKYGEKVRVIMTGMPPNEFSLELCGGTHVDHTAEIGDFFITQETAIAAGMRRIEALTGTEARRFVDEQKEYTGNIRKYLDTNIESFTPQQISQFKDMEAKAHRRILQREGLLESIADKLGRLEKHQRKLQKESEGKLAGKATSIQPRATMGKIVLFVVPARDAKELMVYFDSLRSAYKQSSVIAIAGNNGAFAITSSDNGQAQEIFKEIVAISGGRGGGQSTIRGSMPVDKIDDVISGLKRKFAE